MAPRDTSFVHQFIEKKFLKLEDRFGGIVQQDMIPRIQDSCSKLSLSFNLEY